MAEETLLVDVKARGTRRAAHEIENVSDEIKEVDRASKRVGKSSKIASTGTSLFSEAMGLLGTRTIAGGTAILGLVAVLGPPLLVALAMATAALVALGAVLLPIGLLALGAMTRFKATSDTAGTAANQLKSVLGRLRVVWDTLIAPGADIVMRGLADALTALLPTLESLGPPLTEFATYLADAMISAAEGVKQLAPEFRELLTMAGPMVGKLIGWLPTFGGVLIDIGKVGMPILGWMLDVLAKFVGWLRPAVTDMQAFFSAMFSGQGQAGAVWEGVVGALNDVWRILKSVFQLMVLLWPQIKPQIQAFGIALGVALRLLALGLEWVIRNFHTFEPVINIAFAVLNSFSNAVIWMYQHWKQISQEAPQIWNAITGAITTAIDAVRSSIDWLVDKIQWIIDHAHVAATALDVLTPGGKQGIGSDQGLLGIPKVPVFAEGGTMSKSGPAVVGERGPEVVHLPAGAHVSPGATGDIWIAATFVTPDGQIMARQTLKAARRKQSTR